MANTPQTGEETVIEWTPEGGTMVDMAQFGRNFEPEQTADVYDTTTYSEAKQGYRTYVAGLGDGKSKFEVMYQQGNSAIYKAVAPRTTGTLVIYREGKGAGKPRETVQAIVTKRGMPLPYDNVVILSIEWQHSGTPIEDTVSAA